MEISSFLRLDDLSFVQDSDSSFISFSNAKKRSRFDNVDNDSCLEDVLTKLMEFEEIPATTESFFSVPQNSFFMDSNSNSNSNSTYSYVTTDNSNSLNGYPNLSDPGNSPPSKRKRVESTEAATPTSEDSSGALVNGSVGGQRRLWVKDRSKAWWELVDSPNYPEEEFKKEFRMSRATFDLICEELDTAVTKKNTMLRAAIPVRERVAVCIWRLATGEALREVSKRFGIGISTCHKIVLDVCTAIRNVLMPKVVQWPNEERMTEIKKEFELFSGIPNLGGAMYTTHIPITAPKERVAAYFNKRHTERTKKNSYSITVQGVVDPKGVLTDISIGLPGSMSDEQVLEKSALFQRAGRGALMDTWIGGNSNYPLTDWVLVPYSHQNQSWGQHAFNEKMEEVQRVAKESFMRMKTRWSFLQKRTEMKLQDLPIVLGACCVLHNICEMRNEGLSEGLRFEVFDDEMIVENNVRSVNALHARDQIARNLLHHEAKAPTFIL